MRFRTAVLVVALIITEREAFAACTTPGDLCHTGTGPCDIDTFCDAQNHCPSGNAPSSTSCRDAVDPCDQTEFCTGNSTVCPADMRKPTGAACRPAAGMCDVADVCNASSVCVDNFAPNTQPCRQAVAGGCDITENCTGTSANCPRDLVQPNGMLCRSAAPNSCDVEERCDGSAATCPTDTFKPNTAVCRFAIPGGCDIEEKCTGSTADCPKDVVLPEGQSCSDGNACTVGDACHAGACVAGGPPLVANMVDFGPALVGGNPRSGMLTLEWRDVGSIAVTALNASTTDFRVAASQAFPIALSASATTARIAMEFQPTSLGARTATATATLDPASCAAPTINLVGTGVPPGLAANPTGSDFDQVEVGTTSPPKSFSILNLSGAAAIIQSITVSDPTSFVVVADGLPATLAADASYTYSVAAKPQSGGRHDADVVIVSNSATTPMLTTTVRVEGTCSGGPCAAMADAGAGGGPGSPPGAVSPLSCGVQSGAPSGWVWIVLAWFAVSRRYRR